MPDSRTVEVREKRIEEAPLRFVDGGAGVSLAMDAQPGLDEGTHQIRPDRPLMEGAVPLPDAPLVAGRIAWLAGGEGAQSSGSEKALFHRRDDPARLLSGQQREGKSSHGVDLIRPQRGIHGSRPMAGVHHVVEAPAILIPEPRRERLSPPLKRLFPPIREGAAGGE